MPLSDHLTLEEIQTLLDVAYATMNEAIPYERKKAIEDQVKIMPLNEAQYIRQLIEIKLISKIEYLAQLKMEKINQLKKN